MIAHLNRQHFSNTKNQSLILNNKDDQKTKYLESNEGIRQDRGSIKLLKMKK